MRGRNFVKPWPTLTSDAEAEAFVADADLTEYDPAAMVTVTFERRDNNPFASVKLPEDLVAALRDAAAAAGVSVESFVRTALERAIRQA